MHNAIQERPDAVLGVMNASTNSVNDRSTASACRVRKILQSLNPPTTRPLPSHPARPLPPISASRRASSLSEHPLDLNDVPDHPESQHSTYLYLAYGSNLCHETFQGNRGIKPLAQLNVVVPSLRLTFDLPGIPYAEPCFANTALRDPASTPPGPHPPPISSTPLLPSSHSTDYHKDRWKKGMVGVVYEVTPADYAHIIATEGGGSSYQDILVPCYPLEPGANTVPNIPTTAPFKAHTLFSPQTPPPSPGNPPPKPGTRFARPDPSYAQASARYLKLLTDGADENSFPQDYTDYLYSLRPYTITQQKQRVGQFVFLTLWSPFVLLVFALQRMFQDEKGRSPKWLALLTGAIFQAVWASYDAFFVKLFGDGERTVEGDDGEKEVGRWGRCWRGRGEGESDEEALVEKAS